MHFDVEQITLDHQELLHQLFWEMNTGLSENTFANVYLFRERHKYELWKGKAIYIKGIHHDGKPYAMLTQPVFKLDPQELFYLLSQVDFLYPIPLAWKSFFPEDIFEISTVEDDSDYVYTLDKLRNYPGRKLSGKRNLVRQFLDQYQCVSEILAQNHMQDALKILDIWHQGLDEPDPADEAACTEALRLLGQLKNIEGRIYYIDGQPAGFVIGGNINPRSYVIDFMKGLKEYKGIYQYLYQDYAQNLSDSIEYINLEQDLGKPQLAQAKHSYIPDCICTKLRVSLLPNIKEQMKSSNFQSNFTWKGTDEHQPCC